MDKKIVYYQGWGNYNIPFTPINPISQEAALGLKAFYIGSYEDKILKSFEKILDGKREWIDEYLYWQDTNILQKRKMTKEDGTITEQLFDRKGKLINY